MQLCWRKDSSFASGISKNNSAFLGGLDVALVVASNSVSDSHETELAFVKDIGMLCCKIEKALGKLVVVLLLLYRIVQSTVAQVFFSIGNEEGFQFCGREKSDKLKL